MNNQISIILEEIREYTQKYPELKKSHHFLFNCPLDSQSSYADVIVVGLNPGETQPDWKYGTSLPTEESSEFDFHDELGKGRSSVRWSQLCKDYLPGSNIFLSEFFFWSSGNLDNEFKDRFGYSFKKSPHFGFCKKCNEKMIAHHKPKLVVATGTSWASFFSSLYKMEHIKTVQCIKDRRNRNIIHHYSFKGVPFIFTPHWSSGYVSNHEKEDIKSYLSKYL
tara:strand:+ start:754 stop:1419 length:666 start_codon:yes stop_codon:yes gene_type:complete